MLECFMSRWSWDSNDQSHHCLSLLLNVAREGERLRSGKKIHLYEQQKVPKLTKIHNITIININDCKDVVNDRIIRHLIFIGAAAAEISAG